jgi:hypothetical protein
MPADPLDREGTHTLFPLLKVLRKAYSLPTLVRKLSDLLAQVKDEQEYIVMRERTHRNTAESTNSRVKWWNMFVIGVVIGESLFQVWWLRRFFEVKRVV